MKARTKTQKQVSIGIFGSGVLLVVCMFTLISGSVRADRIVDIYYDDFSGLNSQGWYGTAPDTRPGSETWGASSQPGWDPWKADGQYYAVAAQRLMALPFNPADFIGPGAETFTLSADMDISGPNDSYVSLGFLTTNGVSGTFKNQGGYGTSQYIKNGATGEYAGDDSIDVFTGSGDNGYVDVDGGNYGPWHEFKVVLDCSASDSSDWTMEFFLDGLSISGPSVAASGDFANIRYVGFTADGTSQSYVDNFLLTTTIPEPATMLMLIAPLIGLLLRRR